MNQRKGKSEDRLRRLAEIAEKADRMVEMTLIAMLDEQARFLVVAPPRFIPLIEHRYATMEIEGDTRDRVATPVKNTIRIGDGLVIFRSMDCSHNQIRVDAASMRARIVFHPQVPPSHRFPIDGQPFDYEEAHALYYATSREVAD